MLPIICQQEFSNPLCTEIFSSEKQDAFLHPVSSDHAFHLVKIEKPTLQSQTLNLTVEDRFSFFIFYDSFYFSFARSSQ